MECSYFSNESKNRNDSGILENNEIYFSFYYRGILKRLIQIKKGINVVELPVHLLDDGQIDEVDWKLPEDKKLDELLK